MKKTLLRLLSHLLALALLLPAVPPGAALNLKDDLSALIENAERRRFVQMMLSYYIREDAAVQETLADGLSAVFLFEGCSDNMDHPDLSYLPYYRVSAVCIAVRLDENGEPCITYFNENCSTLPDRPLEFGAWEIEDVGEVGPATVMDGTYEIYSVRHGGAYEALHMRTTEEDETVAAVYMYPEGYVESRATYINVHTRTVNHVIKGAMWSAGCILVGDGEFSDFADLIDATYYASYDEYEKGRRVGTLTINRQFLKEDLYELYENDDAVDWLLAASRQILPEKYLQKCVDAKTLEKSDIMSAAKDTNLMTLPCSNATDARSVSVAQIPQGEKMTILGSLYNTTDNLWYEVEYEGQQGYVYSGHTEELGWFAKFIANIFG